MRTTEEIIQGDRISLLPTYNRYPVMIERGKGVLLFDTDGRRYLDFVCGLGVNALGHAHLRIVRTIREQAARQSMSPTCTTTNTSVSLRSNLKAQGTLRNPAEKSLRDKKKGEPKPSLTKATEAISLR